MLFLAIFTVTIFALTALAYGLFRADLISGTTMWRGLASEIILGAAVAVVYGLTFNAAKGLPLDGWVAPSSVPTLVTDWVVCPDSGAKVEDLAKTQEKFRALSRTKLTITVAHPDFCARPPPLGVAVIRSCASDQKKCRDKGKSTAGATYPHMPSGVVESAVVYIQPRFSPVLCPPCDRQSGFPCPTSCDLGEAFQSALDHELLHADGQALNRDGTPAHASGRTHILSEGRGTSWRGLDCGEGGDAPAEACLF